MSSLLLRFPTSQAGNNGGGTLQITSSGALAAATAGTPYSSQVVATGGQVPYSWQLVPVAGTNAYAVSSSGLINVTPASAETGQFYVLVRDNVGATTFVLCTVTVNATGALTVTSPSTFGATVGAANFWQLSANGGTPPYTWSMSSHTGSNTLYYLNQDGTLQTAATVAGTDTVIAQVKDSVSATASKSFTITASTALAVGGVESTASSRPFAVASNGVKYTVPLFVAGGTSPYTPTVTGLPPGLSVSGTKITGTPTQSGLYLPQVTYADNVGAHASANFSLLVGTATRASRPAGNTGSGFYTAAGRLYDPTGNEFRIRGVNRTHWDSSSNYTLGSANSERTFLDFTRPVLGNVTLMQTCINAAKVPVWVNDTADGSTNPTDLVNATSTWVAQAATWITIQNSSILNILNEWGPSNSTVWRDSYITAIGSLRSAGYTCPLMIDSGGFGQDLQDLVKYAPAVLAADPQQNIVFSFHLYGNTPASSTASFLSQLGALRTSSGVCVVVGEFGPLNVGPSQTQVPMRTVVTLCEQNQLGWMPWAWDDNNGGGGSSTDPTFSFTYQGPGNYSPSAPSGLTNWGLNDERNPIYGLSGLALPASSF